MPKWSVVEVGKPQSRAVFADAAVRPRAVVNNSNSSKSSGQRHSMMDLAMVAIGLIFFAASIAYVFACEQL
jgi:hypothetical protein